MKLKSHKPNSLRILAFGDSLTEGYADYGMTFQPYGETLEHELAQLLPDHRVVVDVDGKSGDCVRADLSGDFLDRIQVAIEIFSSENTQTTSGEQSSSTPESACYDLVIILGGTNDLAYTINDEDGPNDIFTALKECYDCVLESGASLLCLSVPERRIDHQKSSVAQKCKSLRLELNSLIAEYVSESSSESTVVPSVSFMDLASLMPYAMGKDEKGDEIEEFWSRDGLHMTAKGYYHVGQSLANFIYGMIDN